MGSSWSITVSGAPTPGQRGGSLRSFARMGGLGLGKTSKWGSSRFRRTALALPLPAMRWRERTNERTNRLREND